jgi:glycosyltransferase involved in cell wall biosynthesis/CelD/BcsL family acetyltransferase involved in cellulose biosynthesis
MITVVSVSYALAPVSVDAVGGAEVVLAHIDRALSARGHHSIVIAPAPSHVRGTFVETLSLEHEDLNERFREHALHVTQRALNDVLARRHVDVVHFHGLDFGALQVHGDVPVVATLHLPIDFYPPAALDRPNTTFVCVSSSQAMSLPKRLRERAEIIENGVDLTRFRLHTKKHRYALAIGRVCPEKNFDIAIEAANEAGIPLVIAGHVYPYEEHARYFRERIAPALGRRVAFVGPVTGPRKARLIGGASCLLVPSTVRETSSLVSMEALASGTPVIAFPSGALAHIVEHGRTGFLVTDHRSMARAMLRSSSIDPRDCRAQAERRFDLEKNTARYIELFSRAASRSSPRQTPLVIAPSKSAIRVELVSTLAAAEAIGSEWNALWNACPWATTFQRPEWVLASYRHLSPHPPRILVARKSSEMVGLLPLAMEPADTSIWMLAGTGPSDILDVLARREVADECSRALLQTLAADPRWNALEFHELRDTSPLLVALRAGLAGKVSVDSPLSRCPELVADDPGSLAHLVPRHWARRVAHDIRICERARLRVEVSLRERAREHVETWRTLHEARWASRGSSGILRGRESFDDDALVRLIENGHAMSLELRDEEDIARASCMILLERSRAAFYLAGFDPSIARRSPVVVLVGFAIAMLTARGFVELDFLRGADDYKHRWGTRDRIQYRIRIERPR